MTFYSIVAELPAQGNTPPMCAGRSFPSIMPVKRLDSLRCQFYLGIKIGAGQVAQQAVPELADRQAALLQSQQVHRADDQPAGAYPGFKEQSQPARFKPGELLLSRLQSHGQANPGQIGQIYLDVQVVFQVQSAIAGNGVGVLVGKGIGALLRLPNGANGHPHASGRGLFHVARFDRLAELVPGRAHKRSV